MTRPIEAIAARTVGVVDAVSPTQISVLLDVDAPQSTALSFGEPTGFPRINSYLLVPNEIGAVVGLVDWIGVEASAFPKRTGLRDFGLVDLPYPIRRLKLTPVGTLHSSLDRPSGRIVYDLRRGLAVFPSVGDSVLIPNHEQVKAIIAPSDSTRRVPIGTSPLHDNIGITVDPDRLFGQHVAVLGNTGSGKSCTVAGLIRWSLDAAKKHMGDSAGEPHARFIILDPNGEYATAFADLNPKPRVFQVRADSDSLPLTVPAWLWDSREWIAFAQARPGAQRPLLLQALRELRGGAPGLSSPERDARRRLLPRLHTLEGHLSSGPSTEFPVPTNIGHLLRRLESDLVAVSPQCPVELRGALDAVAALAKKTADDRAYMGRNGEGFNAFGATDLQAVIDVMRTAAELFPGDGQPSRISEDSPVPFHVAELPDQIETVASDSEAGGRAVEFVSTLLMRIRSMVNDARLGPIVAPTVEQSLADWLASYLADDTSETSSVSIVDLSLVPSDVVHLVTAVIARVTFEATQRYLREHQGLQLPTVLVLEEAHRFIQRGSAGDELDLPQAAVCRDTFERIAREGRKFGFGLVLSSQRPYELSPTVLAQCNSYILHRLVNDADRQLVGRLVPDNLGGLLDELPSLPARQAILLGSTTPVPVLVEISELPSSHQPRSKNPSFWGVWTRAESRPTDWQALASAWQETN